MNLRSSVIAVLTVTMLQAACSHAGDAKSPDPRGAAACDPKKTPDCEHPNQQAPAASPQPTVPPVPKSPLKVECDKLPTQVERDTCTNRKESTG